MPDDKASQTPTSDAEVRRISMVVRARWDHNRYAAWLDDRSPHYGDADHFVRLVLEAAGYFPGPVEIECAGRWRLNDLLVEVPAGAPLLISAADEIERLRAVVDQWGFLLSMKRRDVEDVKLGRGIHGVRRAR